LGKFRREDSEEHMRENTQTHLSMMAATSVKVQQEFQIKLQEQEQRFSAQQQEFQIRLQQQEQRFGEKCSAQQQEFQTKLQEQEQRFSAQQQEFQTKLQEQEGKIIAQRQEFLAEQARQKTLLEKYKDGAATELDKLKRICGIRKFTMENFSKKKANGDIWKSPPMYTTPGGYKLCIVIDTNLISKHMPQSECVKVELLMMSGEYDNQLEWPVTATFTLELINHFEDGENMAHTVMPTWWKRLYSSEIDHIYVSFIFHSESNPATRTHFLKDDALHFILSVSREP
jgi:small-conductance mechanosensitive channel